jgi:short-subunit dehydrogenase
MPYMIAQGGGHIVNTASMAGLIGLPLVAPYCMTKFAIVGLSEALGAELSVHGICVTAVCPASVRTSLMRSARLELPGPWQKWIHEGLDRYAPRPEALAAAIVSAVLRKQSMVIRATELLPLWLLKRTSIALYQRASRVFTRAAMRLGAQPTAPGSAPRASSRPSDGLSHGPSVGAERLAASLR